MKIATEYVLRLTPAERKTIETAVWLLLREPKASEQERERATALYDRFTGLIPEPASAPGAAPEGDDRG